MERLAMLGTVALVGASVSGGVLYYYFRAFPKADFRSLMASGGAANLSAKAKIREGLEDDESGEAHQQVQKLARKTRRKKKEPTLEERMFMAGIFTDQEKKDFRRIQLLAPPVFVALFPFLFSFFGGLNIILLGPILGLIIGFYLPFKVLDRKKKRRDDDILYYLPLVVEQVAIGVSSSLDTGPCLQRVVAMADERDNHNPVTELLRYTEFHVRSGVSLDEALNEIGTLSGQTELKHTFLSLAQVTKFGGEVTKQLQELADSVSSQRETKVEEKIKRLELEATLPVAMVFFGFIVMLLMGFGVQVMKAFK